ncbi:MAG: hypothetical protein V1690_03070 [Candidatus Moraniibacteriota bacterium]
MKKIKIVIFIAVLCGAALLLSGGVTLSREKIVPKALWNAVTSPESTGSKVDSDNDGLPDEQEKEKGTDPKKADTDGDGFLDGQEVKNGYDPLRAAPGDKVIANSNSNSNSNTNSHTPSTGRDPSPEGTNTNASLNIIKDNLTEKVALKVDDLISRYQLHTIPYASLNDDTRTELEKEVDEFTQNMLQTSGLDFAFNVPGDSLTIQDNEPANQQEYLNRAKAILRQHNILTDNQSIEDGIRAIVNDLSGMSKQDIDWEKTSNLQKEASDAYRELFVLGVNPEQKNLHIRLLRVVRSLEIVLENIDSGDYFKSYLAAGRAEKINGEIDKFSNEIK